MNLFIIILNWNGQQDTLECLNSLQQVHTPHQVIIVDNGSTDQSVLTFKEKFPDIVVIETGKNLGYAGGNNIGIVYALNSAASHILILNNDTIVDPELLNAFLQQNGDILGAKTLDYSNSNKLDHLGGNWNPKKAQFDLIGYQEEEQKWNFPKTLDYVCGCALFVKAEVFKKIGLFEPRFFLFWEEADWCTRAIRAGYQPTLCPKAKVAHKGSASFTGGTTHTTYFWWRNRLFWIERNCSRKEKKQLYIQVLIPEITHLFKLYLLKSLQLFFLKCLNRQKNLSDKSNRLRTYKAALAGVKDYFIRRFGNGPSWIFMS